MKTRTASRVHWMRSTPRPARTSAYRDPECAETAEVPRRTPGPANVPTLHCRPPSSGRQPDTNCARGLAIRTLFAANVRSVERCRADVRIRLTGGVGLRERVRDLTDRESSCCSFFTFALAGTDQDLTLDVSVPAARQEILDALAVRAEELSA